MGNFEKLVVMTVLFLSVLVLAVSLRSGPDEGEAGPLGGPSETLAAERGAETPGLLNSSVEVPGEGAQAEVPAKPGAGEPLGDDAATVAPKPGDPVPVVVRWEGLEPSRLEGFLRYTPVHGDTWPALANRFYGSPERANLLLLSNEDVSSGPPVAGRQILVPAFDLARPDPQREPAKPRPVAEKKPATPGVYVVQSGDTLSEIAEEVYGKSGRWRDIFDANRALLPSPDVLQVGMQLRIPQ